MRHRFSQIRTDGHGRHSGKANSLIYARLGESSSCLKDGPLTTPAHIGYRRRLAELEP